ncbi:MAG: DinB family protein [Ignavibacteriales bacterium]|nr:DinB family protein [Ignavibacteriales bacterium]
MEFSISKSIAILERTPSVLRSLLQDLPNDWTMHNEGGETWSPYDIVGHYIHGEKTDWIPRMQIILSNAGNKTFEPFDRFAQFTESKGKTLTRLLDEFASLREKNIEIFRSAQITDEMLKRTGAHPTFGTVTLQQLLATWVAHDLNHIWQIAQVMAVQYKEHTGPWVEFLGILKR